MSEQEVKFTLRVPGDLHAQLQEWAKQEERSIHSLIIVTLRRALADREAQQRTTRKPIDRGGTIEDESRTLSRDAVSELEEALVTI